MSRPLGSKNIPLTKSGVPHRSYAEDPLFKVVREKLNELRNERLEFVLVGCRESCVNDCWKQREAQEADRNALRLFGDTVPAGQFPLMCLKEESEIDANFRGYILRCHCLSTPTEQDT